eukprot:PhM_4_TR9189/c0_g3_i2/m.67786
MPIHFVIHPRCDEFDQSPTIRKIDFVSTNSDFCKNKHRFGYHPTASKALLLLRISTCNIFCSQNDYGDDVVDGFRLRRDNTEDVLSFCVDHDQVLIDDVFPSKPFGCVHDTTKTLIFVNDEPHREITSITPYTRSACVDLSALTNVRSIGYGFLMGCHNLTAVDLSGLRNVTSIESEFLSDC